MATGAALLAIATLLTVGTLVGCGKPAKKPSPSPSPTATWLVSPSPSPTPTIAFTPWPPGKASAAQALAVGREYAARSTAETVGTSNVLAADSTLDNWLADEFYRGTDVADYFDRSAGAPAALDWAQCSRLPAPPLWRRW
jgi:hypothetical protein